MVDVGVDLHKHVSQIAVLTPDGVVRQHPIPGAIREYYRALLKVLDEQIRWLDLELSHRWGDDPRVRRLITIPGIGPFVAILLVLELGEIQRFPSAKQK